MATFERFEQIISWKESRELNKIIGKLIDNKRFENNFRLINQIEGSAGSIMDNIAEGFERGGNREFIQFLYISKSSCGELRSQLYRALDRSYISQEEYDVISVHAMKISSLIQKLINYLESSPIRGNKYKERDKEVTTTSETS
jgi:four helix bundle protein